MAVDIVLKKACAGCLEVKSATCFSPHVNTKDRLQPKCKACRNAAYRAKNASSSPVRARSLSGKTDRWRDYYSAEGRREDKRKYYLENKQATIDRAKRWAKNNPSVMAARAMHRLALQRSATPSWADLELIESIYAKAKQLEAETGIKWHVDHSVPLKSKLVCGLHVQDNLVLMTASENIAKSNRHWPDMP